MLTLERKHEVFHRNAVEISASGDTYQRCQNSTSRCGENSKCSKNSHRVTEAISTNFASARVVVMVLELLSETAVQ